MLELRNARAALSAPAGAITLLTGPSGAGKTRWLRRLAGLDPMPDGVRAALDGAPWPPRRPQGMVFYAPDARPPLWLGATVHEELAFGIGRLDADRARAALDDWGARIPLDTPTITLAKLDALRVRLAAMALAAPRLALLDDPLSFLDDAPRRAIAHRLRDWARSTGAIVVVADERRQDWRATAARRWRCAAPDAMPAEESA